MHPEIVQDGPGRCPKCGMALVPQESLTRAPARHKTPDRGLGVLTWKSYLPLLMVISFILIGTLGASLYAHANNTFTVADPIIYFMTGFFIVFSLFKLIDLKGFAEGYATYDLLAMRWYTYGYVYPFIELLFGVLMLLGMHTPLVLWAEIIVMGFSGIGVSVKLAKGEEFQCACLGTFLKVPLTKITVVEDFGMVALAAALLYLLP